MLTKKFGWIGLFGLSMAYFESAVVVYLRELYDISDLMVSRPLLEPRIGVIEIGREAASLVMLLAVGWVAGRKLQSQLGFSLFAFGIWDIFYYAWLRIFIGWPVSLLDPDILFFIPLPWWGPVLAPVMISILMILAGILAVVREGKVATMHATPLDWAALSGGTLLLLYALMMDALKALPADLQTLNTLRPTLFNWPVFLAGLSLTGVFVWRMAKSSSE